MDAADNMLESADDMTAAEIAPRPRNATHFGVKYIMAKGTTMPDSSCSPGSFPYSVSFQATQKCEQF